MDHVFGKVAVIVANAAVIATLLTFAGPPVAAAGSTGKGQNCRLEKQCRWVNFKQICYYVRVCR